MIWIFLACDALYPKPAPRPAPEPVTPGQRLSMVPPRWVQVEERDGKPMIVSLCGKRPKEIFVDKTAKGGPFFEAELDGVPQRWRMGEVQGEFGADVWTIPLEGVGLLRPEVTLRWLDRPHGIAEWSGGPFSTPVVVVSGDKDLLLDSVREPCL